MTREVGSRTTKALHKKAWFVVNKVPKGLIPQRGYITEPRVVAPRDYPGKTNRQIISTPTGVVTKFRDATLSGLRTFSNL